MTMMGFTASGGRQGTRGSDPHYYFEKTNDDIIAGEPVRERMWVIRRGEGDWHAFIGRGNCYHYTSSDGVSWSAGTKIIDASNKPDVQDLCVCKDPSAGYFMLAEDEDSTPSSAIWTPDDGTLDASSWSLADEFSTKFGNGERPGVANPTPWYDSGTGTWYCYIEEWQAGSSDYEYIRAISCSSDPTVASNWTDEQRIVPYSDWVPKGIWTTSNGDPRMFALSRWGDFKRWWVLKPNGSLTSWTRTNIMFADGPAETGVSELTPPHEPNGYEEYLPEGKDRPWAYGWNNMGDDADNNYDLLKGVGVA